MKLRLDLLKFATPQEAVKEALAQNPRYAPEPRFSKTGVGSLSPATTGQFAQEVERSTERIQKALRLAEESGDRCKAEKKA